MFPEALNKVSKSSRVVSKSSGLLSTVSLLIFYLFLMSEVRSTASEIDRRVSLYESPADLPDDSSFNLASFVDRQLNKLGKSYHTGVV